MICDDAIERRGPAQGQVVVPSCHLVFVFIGVRTVTVQYGLDGSRSTDPYPCR